MKKSIFRRMGRFLWITAIGVTISGAYAASFDSNGGLVVCVGGGADQSELWGKSNTVVQCLESTDSEVAKLRKDTAQDWGSVDNIWNHQPQMHGRAIALADGTLFVAGVNGDWPHSDSIFARKAGVTLSAVSAEDGLAIGEVELDAFLVFDGMAVACGKLYVADDAGNISCFE